MMVVVGSRDGLRQEIEAGPHRLVADEPAAAGGTDAGPDPYALLLASLGACTSMTLLLYARCKGWPLQGVEVELRHARVHADDCAGCEDPRGLVDQVTRRIRLAGPLDGAQLQRLGEIARKCPVHKTLSAGVRIVDEA